MNQADFRAQSPYATFGTVAVDASEDARRTFIRKTYTHLAAAIYAFAALEWLFISMGFDEKMLQLIGPNQMMWLVVIGAFMGVSWIANRWANSSTSIGMQYAGLFLYVLAEAVIFLPLMGLAKLMSTDVPGVGQVNVVAAAGVTTLLMFGGLTAFTFLTKKDFSFLGGFLSIAMLGAFALIVVSALFGFNLGVWFSALMVIAASGYILFYTSQIMQHYRTDQYVAAALALFASVALLFWYVLQIFMASRD
jgi:FtsH-binding integral membrane protein